MRFRLDVRAAVDRPIPWPEVFTPVRVFLYDVVRRANPGLSQLLHDEGWGGSPLRPLAGTCPLFVHAPKRPGQYTVSGNGSIWLGSPVPAVASALLAGASALTGTRMAWGSCPLDVVGLAVEPEPEAVSGQVIVSTRTPVLVKSDSRWILADHPEYLSRLRHNVTHKADLLGLPPEMDVEITGTGPRRMFKVDGAPRIGHTVAAVIAGHPRTLAALASWGLGLHNNSGFGWVS